MTTARITALGALAILALLAAGGLAMHVGSPPEPSVKRTELQRHDLSAPGREAVQVRIDFSPGAVFGKHTHPGEEVIYVLEGTLQYQVDGKLSTLSAGDVLFIPAGTVHAAKNAGSNIGVELATYVVEKGKPLVVMVE